MGTGKRRPLVVTSREMDITLTWLNVLLFQIMYNQVFHGVQADGCFIGAQPSFFEAHLMVRSVYRLPRLHE